MKSRAHKKLAIHQIENLVFQGGSVKGIAYLGAWEALRQLGLDPAQLKRVGGTSAGSITALLLALGYTDPLVLTDMMGKLSFVDMLDEPNASIAIGGTLLKAGDKASAGGATGTLGAIAVGALITPVIANRFKKQGGLFDGKYLQNWFEKLIKERTGLDNCTFAQLKALQNKRPELGLKDLYVVAVNRKTKISEVFSYDKKPNAIISESVRASMSIPLVFIPQGVYLDGGLLDNYPLFLFDHIDGGRTTLGFQLLGQEKINMINGVEPEQTDTKEKSILSSIVSMMINLRTAKQFSDHLNNPDHISRSVPINHLGVGTLDFNLNEATKQALIESGRAGILEYFEPNAPVPPSKVIEKLEQKKIERGVRVYVWTSAVNPVEPGHKFGHVSIQTNSTYISLWPKASNTPQEKALKDIQKKSRYSSQEYYFQPSLEMDIAASDWNSPTYEVTFDTLSREKLEEKFLALQQTMTGWALTPGLCSDDESCASIAMTLLEAAGLNNLISHSERLDIACTGSGIGLFSIFSPKLDQTRKDASVDGSTFAAEMLLSTVIKSPDAALDILKKAAQNEAKITALPPRIAMRQ